MGRPTAAGLRRLIEIAGSEINRGSESVPTLVFPDGSTLTEPSLTALQDKLRTMGREIPPPRWLQAIMRLFGKGERPALLPC